MANHRKDVEIKGEMRMKANRVKGQSEGKRKRGIELKARGNEKVIQ